MPSPFPGMDPYLEAPAIWPEVHTVLFTEFLSILKPRLRPHYKARMDSQVTIERTVMPDIAVVVRPLPLADAPTLVAAPAITPPTLTLDDTFPFRRASIEILTRDDGRLVTVIEVLSPINKSPYDRRYRDKRDRIIRSGVHLLEIDLLRDGQRVLASPDLPTAPYWVTLRRGDRYPPYEVWAVQLRDPLPVIPVPLLPEDDDLPLDLGMVFDGAYERGDYAHDLDYTADPVPPLSPEDAAWADARLREQGLRP